MKKNEMIKELLRIIGFYCIETPTELCNKCCDECLASAIYNAGYRKIDVATADERGAK